MFSHAESTCEAPHHLAWALGVAPFASLASDDSHVMRGSRSAVPVQKAVWWAVGALTSGGAGFGMANLVDAGFTAEWSPAAGTAWAAGLIGAILFAVYALVRFWRILEGEADVPNPPLLELPPAGAPAVWQQRARAGALIILGLGGWAALGFVIWGIRAGDPIRGLFVGVGWCLVLGLSGATGGVVYHLTDSIRLRGWLGRPVANVVSVLAYCATAIVLLGLAFLVGGRL